MAQASWASDTNNWSASPYIWYNTTYQEAITLSSEFDKVLQPVLWDTRTTTWATNDKTWDYDAPNASCHLARQGIVTLGSSVSSSVSGGFSLVGVADFNLGAGSTSSGNTVYINAIEINGTAVLNSVGNMPITGSITLGSGLGVQQSDLLGWAITSESWSGITNNWNYDATVSMPTSADLTQINLSELHEEDAEKIASAVYGIASGTSASGNIQIPVTATLENNQDIKFNINFEESITITGKSNITSSNNFLWNDQEEDASTIWTKIADPDA